MKLQYTKQSLSTLIAAGLFSLTIPSTPVAELAGAVQGANQPIAGSPVTIHAAGTGEPAQLPRGKPQARFASSGPRLHATANPTLEGVFAESAPNLVRREIGKE